MPLQKLFDRVPPHSIEAEMCLLGSMLLDYKVIPDVLPLVNKGEAFYRQSHAAIFDAVVYVYNEHHSGDIVQILERLRDMNALEEVGGQEYLVQLAESVPTAVNAPHYARIVRDKAQLRKLIETAGQILYDAYNAGEVTGEQAREVLDSAEQRIFEVVEQTVGVDFQTLAELLHQSLDVLDANFSHGRRITGLATGFYDLDEMTGGFQPGELVILAARPSMGKTALGLNLAEQIALGGSPHDRQTGGKAPIAFFSLEMSRQAISMRLLSAHSRVDSQKMRKNMLSHDDFQCLVESCSALSEAPIFIDDMPGLTPLQLRAKARRLAAQHGIRCMIIDYLQLMTAPQAAREGRQAEVSVISRNVKAVARELNIPVICLAQLNRGAEQRDGHRPRMADLRESGSIEQDADVILLLHREEYYHVGDEEWEMNNPDKIGTAEVIIAKQRNGPTGTVRLTWDSKTTRFRNYAYSSGGGEYAAPQAGSQAEPKKASYAPGSRTGSVSDHRDGGGPDREWDGGGADDLPI